MSECNEETSYEDIYLSIEKYSFCFGFGGVWGTGATAGAWGKKEAGEGKMGAVVDKVSKVWCR